MLRFKGLNSYLFGNSQLIYFEELRNYLRQNNDGPLRLELCEKEKEESKDGDQSFLFPPIAIAKAPLLEPEAEEFGRRGTLVGGLRPSRHSSH